MMTPKLNYKTTKIIPYNPYIVNKLERIKKVLKKRGQSWNVVSEKGKEKPYAGEFKQKTSGSCPQQLYHPPQCRISIFTVPAHHKVHRLR